MGSVIRYGARRGARGQAGVVRLSLHVPPRCRPGLRALRAAAGGALALLSLAAHAIDWSADSAALQRLAARSTGETNVCSPTTPPRVLPPAAPAALPDSVPASSVIAAGSATGDGALAPPAASVQLEQRLAADPDAPAPATDDPGTLVEGGRRQALTFTQLGAPSSVRLDGFGGSVEVPFSVRADEVVTGAVLHLVYRYPAPAGRPDTETPADGGAQLSVQVNGVDAGALPLPGAQSGVLVERDVTIDPRIVTEYSHLDLRLVPVPAGGATARATDAAPAATPAPSVLIANFSSLELTYATLPGRPDLATLPAPFFDAHDVRRLKLPVVFAAPPDADALAAAGIVASWFGAFADYRGARFPASVGALPDSGNAVVFATAQHPPAGLALPPISGPTVAVVARPAPATGALLLVLGRDGQELRTAAARLALSRGRLGGGVATFAATPVAAQRRPYEAPKWLPSAHPVRLGDLASAGSLVLGGTQGNYLQIGLRLPPDLFTWDSPGIPFDLRYDYGAWPADQPAQLGISLDHTAVDTLDVPLSGFDLLTAKLRRLVTSAAGASTPTGQRRKIWLSPCLLLSRTELEIGLWPTVPLGALTAPAALPAGSTVALAPDSTLDLSALPHHMTLPDLAAFANNGFPFTRFADLSGTAVILPDAPSADDYSLYLLEMGRMGASTGYPVTGVTVAPAADVARYADKDLLLIGDPARQPLFARWADAIPYSHGPGTLTPDALMRSLNNWWKHPGDPQRAAIEADLDVVRQHGAALIAGFRSPLDPAQSAVALVSTDGPAYLSLESALLDTDLIPSIQGGMVVVQGRSVTSASNGDRYYVGRLAPVQEARWMLSLHPFVLLVCMMLVAMIFAARFFRSLRTLAARRLGH